MSRNSKATADSASTLAISYSNWTDKSVGVDDRPAKMASPPAGKADHVIFIWLGGGMSQIDTFDPKGGRGHQSSTFSLVLAGGDLKHRGAIGLTDEWSKHVAERPVSIPDFHATIHHALGIDFQAELYDGNRPVPITDGGKPIAELFV